MPVTNLPSESPPGFRATGQSKARSVFQGNHVARSVVLFENARTWLIGGVRDEEANLLIGMRASLSLHNAADMTVRGNYIHTEIPSFRWSQVHTLSVGGACPNLVIEHNVIRHGQWVVRGVTGEFRYNLVLDADGHGYSASPARNPKGPSGGGSHVVRGGSFASGAAWVRSAARGPATDTRSPYVGFRCAYDAP